MRVQLTSCEKGFTFVEILVTMLIFSIITIAVLNLFDTSMMYLKRGQILTDRQDKARLAMGLIEHELFNAYTAWLPSSSSIAFRARAGILLQQYGDYTTIETVIYQLNGTTLQRAANTIPQSSSLSNPTTFQTVISDVRSLTFTKSGKTIKVDLSVNTPSPGKYFMPYTSLFLSRTVFVRNF